MKTGVLELNFILLIRRLFQKRKSLDSIIRHKTFETNSSSSHSIFIAQGDFDPDGISLDRNNNITIYTDEFLEDGWFDDAYTKAAYALTYLMEEAGGFKFPIMGNGEANYNIKIPPVLDAAKAEMLQRVIKKYTGANNVFLDIDEDSGISHDCEYTCQEAFESEETLGQFIFNRNSILEMSYNG